MNSIEETIKNYLCDLEGYMIKSKELHWLEKNEHLHETLGDIKYTLNNHQDTMAESLFASYPSFQINEFMPNICVAGNINELIESIETSIFYMRDLLNESDDLGIKPLIENLIIDMNRYKYLSTLH